MTKQNKPKDIEEIVEEFVNKFCGTQPDGSNWGLTVLFDEKAEVVVKNWLRQTLISQCKEMEEKTEHIISLILPLAKGYVAKNDIGSNRKYIEVAESYLQTLKD